MKKSIRELRIDPEGISIVSSIHEVIRNILQIDLYTKRDEAEEIFKEYGLDNVENSTLALDVIQLLSGEDRLAGEKLEKHIKKHELRGKEPNEKSLKIEFKFRTINESLRKMKDEATREAIQVDIYSKAKELEYIFKNTNVDVKIKMRFIDKIYFTFKNIFSNSYENKGKALNPGNEDTIKAPQEKTPREELMEAILVVNGLVIGNDGKPQYNETKNLEGKGREDD